MRRMLVIPDRRSGRRSLPRAALIASMTALALLAAACSGSSTKTQASAPAGDPTSSSASTAPSPTESGVPARAAADLVIWADAQRAPVLQKIGDEFGKENGIKVAVQPISTDLQTAYVTATEA